MSAATRVDTRTTDYQAAEAELYRQFNEFGRIAPEREVCENLALFITPQHFRRMMFFCEMYKLILDKPGSILQFGVRWGRELALFENLRTPNCRIEPGLSRISLYISQKNIMRRKCCGVMNSARFSQTSRSGAIRPNSLNCRYSSASAAW
jgi:hypothetical protein